MANGEELARLKFQQMHPAGRSFTSGWSVNSFLTIIDKKFIF